MLFKAHYTSEEANKTIQNFVNSQLVPTVEELENLAVTSLRFRIGIFGLIYRRRLHTLQHGFRDKAKNFLTLYHIYTSPDKLFADLKLDPQKDEEMISQLKADYENSKDLVSYHLDRGFRMIEFVQGQLDDYQRNIDARLAVFLSILAIGASISSILFSYY